ncbi:DUF4153 domain-containing protein [Aliigemmobacter aestuarii]|nr:DUF4173 domain-containing protein [Gemmobacter aestuarii]
MRVLTIGGLPTSILQDAWWMDADLGTGSSGTSGAAGIGTGDESAARRTPPPAGVMLAALVALADLLFFDHPPGLSVAIFLIAFGIAATIAVPVRGRRLILAWAILTLAALPVAVALTPLSITIAIIGALAACASICDTESPLKGSLLRGILRLAASVPVRGASDLVSAMTRQDQAKGSLGQSARRAGGAWAMPLVAGGGFVLLLASANPILGQWIEALVPAPSDPERILRRAGFWLIASALIWPLVAALSSGRLPALHPELASALRLVRPEEAAGEAAGIGASDFGFNPVSIGNALILFNALFAVQTALDLTYLWGGADLPDGMTYAGYAHRGAYPLVATALLAGAFALISRPFTDRSPLLRPLLILWVAQNVLLVVSALLRLDLYVTAYGLTHLRLAAGIWMALVAGGLCLTLWQIAGRHGNRWLLLRVIVMAGAVLYGCAFVNAPGIVAKVNIGRAEAGMRVDRAYVCALGPMAAAEIAAHDRRALQPFCIGLARPPVPEIDGWRDWGLRKALIRRYLLAQDHAGAREERP